MIDKIIQIGEENQFLLKEFLLANPIARINFRYFEKRNLSPYLLNNHIVTNLYYEGIVCVGYGHLDKDHDIIWLGIMVSDKHRRMGFGNFIMNDLISNKNADSIYLSVDKTNLSAINLYIKKGFKIMEEKSDIYIMRHHKSKSK
ncbi:MAG: GNAT family N-acetyltransferase [Bacteroidales bacterium]|nr:GNAT family N-acetyltransferase [Flavobacteriaceae bacterium]MDD2635456.1 GNAT family N-acetyltransferase [Bacteroidales bacterium]